MIISLSLMAESKGLVEAVLPDYFGDSDCYLRAFPVLFFALVRVSELVTLGFYICTDFQS